MKERLEITKRVMRAMRHNAARRPLAGPSDDGHQHVVVCVREDSLEYAAERVRANGGYATVVVPSAGNRALVPLVWEQRVEHVDSTLVSDEQIHPDSTMGMLVDYMETATAGGHMAFRITVGDSEASIHEGDELSVPA